MSGRKGSLRLSLPFKSRLEAASPRAPRALPGPRLFRALGVSRGCLPTLSPWRSSTHRGPLLSQDGGQPRGTGRLLARCASRVRRDEVAPVEARLFVVGVGVLGSR